MMIDDAHDVGLPGGQGLKSAGCNGVLLSFASPIDTMPRAGDYKITRESDYPPGTVTALFSGPRKRVGLWPLATSAYVNAYYGVVHLDSMDRKYICARFELVVAASMVARRRLVGEGAAQPFANGSIKLPALTPSASAWKFSTTR
jgi:hypothetical protein